MEYLIQTQEMNMKQQEQLYFINDNRYIWKEEQQFASNMKSLFHLMKKEINKHEKQLDFYEKRRIDTCRILKNAKQMKHFQNDNSSDSLLANPTNNETIEGIDQMKLMCQTLKRNISEMENKFEFSEQRIDDILNYLDDLEETIFPIDNQCENEEIEENELSETNDSCSSYQVVEKNDKEYNRMNTYLHEQTMNYINEMYQCHLLVSSVGNRDSFTTSDSTESSDYELHDHVLFNSSEFDEGKDVYLLVPTNDDSKPHSLDVSNGSSGFNSLTEILLSTE